MQEENQNYDNKFDKIGLYADYVKYLDAEDELEDMICDGIIEIYVDVSGSFHYYPSKFALQFLGQYTNDIKMYNFSKFLELRGLDINKFGMYRNLMKKRH
jgi:hypothetical protein